MTWRLRRLLTPKPSHRGRVADSSAQPAQQRGSSRQPRAEEQGRLPRTPRQPRREERHMWDMVKPVSEAYTDAYNAL